MIIQLPVTTAVLEMQVLFQVTVSKSAIDRWVDEIGDSLPSEEEMIKLLDKEKPITQGRFDELFPLDTGRCLVVLKDEHGRIIATQEVAHRDEEHVKPFLERMKRFGLDLAAFYIDHWQAYANAIKIYQAVTYLGWSIHNPPNLAASGG